MRLNTTLYRWPGTEPEGDIDWDSGAGTLSGSLAEEILRYADEAREVGWVPAGPQFAYEYPADDPLRKPDQFAALLAVMGFMLNRPELAELAGSYNPEFKDPKLEKMTEAQRRTTVF